MSKGLAAVLALSMGLPAYAGLAEDLASQEALVAQLRTQTAPAVAPLLVQGADIRVFASLAPLVQAVALLNSALQANRAFTLQSTQAGPRFWQDGATWCNSYAELASNNALNASGYLSQLQAAVQDGGVIELTSRANTQGHMQVHFHFMGPRVRGPLGIGNVCAPGGGVGSSIGVGFQKIQDLAVQLRLTPSPDGQLLNYTAALTSPRTISVTAQIGLQHIGTIGHPLSFDIPQTPLAQGSLPLFISNEGTFTLPGTNKERAYAVALTPKSFLATKNGVVAQWQATAKFKPVGP